MRYLHCSQDWIQKAFWQVVHVWFAKRRFAKKNSMRNSLNLSYQIPNKQEECNHCIMSQLAPCWGLSYDKDIFPHYIPYTMLIHCFMKNVRIFFLYFPVHPRFTISELIESDNKTNGKTSQKPLQSHCIFYNKYRKLGLYWRFYHVPTRNYIPIYIQNNNLFLNIFQERLAPDYLA